MPINYEVDLLRLKFDTLVKERSTSQRTLTYLVKSLNWEEAKDETEKKRIEREIERERRRTREIENQIAQIKLEISREIEKEEQHKANQIAGISSEIIQKRELDTQKYNEYNEYKEYKKASDALKLTVNSCRVAISGAMNPKNTSKSISPSNNLAAKYKIGNHIRDIILKYEKAIPSEGEAIATLKSLAKEIHDYNKSKNPHFHKPDALDRQVDEMLDKTKKFVQTTVPHGEAIYNLAEYMLQATDKSAQAKNTSAEKKGSFFRWGPSKTPKNDQSTKLATNEATKLDFARKTLDYLQEPDNLRKDGTDLETVLVKAISENNKVNEPDGLDGIFQKLLTDVRAEKAALGVPSTHLGLS